MPPYLQRGKIPAKRHTALRREGRHKGEGIYYEEVVTTAGFGRAYSIVYHLRPPTRVTKIESAGIAPLEIVHEPALRHHHLKSGKMPKSGDPISGRVPVLANDDVTLSRCRPAPAHDELFRNACADEIIFVHHGKGTLHTMFGPLPFRACDYIVIPRTTTYRIVFEGDADLLVIESTGSLTVPPHYVNPDGQIRMGAPYSDRDFHGPKEMAFID